MRLLFAIALGLPLLAGCASQANKAAGGSSAPQSGRRVFVPLNPAWQQFARQHYQEQVRWLLGEAMPAVFPHGVELIQAEYVPEAGTFLDAEGEVQFQNANGAREEGWFTVRWQAPGQAVSPDVPWKVSAVSVSPYAPPPTTTTAPGTPGKR